MPLDSASPNPEPTPSSMLDAALDPIGFAFARGFGSALIRLPPAAKDPPAKGWKTAPPTTEVQAREWVAKGFNLGLRTGPLSGLFVIDDDQPKKGCGPDGTFVVPPTGLVAESPTGSRHYYYVAPNPCPTISESKLAPNVDTRGDRGYVVYPGSTHPDGGQYRWTQTGQPALLPAEVIEALARRKKPAARKADAVHRTATAPLVAHESRYARAALDSECAAVSGAREGERNGTLNRAAFALGQFVGAGALDEVEVVERLTEAARACGLEERETAATIRSGLDAGKGEPREIPPPKPLAPKKAKRKQYAETDESTADDAEASGDDICRKLTDTGNAERFVDRFGGQARHCYPWKKWLTWTGQAWRVDDRGTAMRWSKDVVRGIYAEARTAPDHLREAIAGWAIACEKLDRRRALVELAKSEPGIPIGPEELDLDPWLFNCRNGTVDLRDGTLHGHRREDYITKTAPVVFDPNAEAKHWVEFLERVIPDPEVREFIQRAAGYSLTGDVGEQVLFFLLGGGANGKSTFLRMLQEAMGMAYAIQAAPDLLLSKHSRNHPTELADLFRVRMAVCMEVGSDRSFDEVTVKQVTGGDRIRARRMKEDFWEFDPTHKLWLGANHRPKVQGTDDAIWRRILVVPFPVFIPEDQRDKQLVSKLRNELPGILAWMVRGCLAWRRDGLNPPDQVRLAVQDYRSEMDVVGRFLDEACVFASHLQVGATELYAAYQGWCHANGIIAGTQNELSGRVIQRGAERRKRGVYRYCGVALRGQGDAAERGPFGPSGPSSTLLASRGLSKAPKHVQGPKGPEGPQSAPDVAENGGLASAARADVEGLIGGAAREESVELDPVLPAGSEPVRLRGVDSDDALATEDGLVVRFSRLTLLGNGVYLTPAGQQVCIDEHEGGARG